MRRPCLRAHRQIGPLLRERRGKVLALTEGAEESLNSRHNQKRKPAGNAARGKDKPEFARRIVALQRATGFEGNQAGFSNYIRKGLAQGTLSAWASGKRRPSAEMFARLGSIALDPDEAVWFYEQAGYTKDGMLKAAEAVWGKKFEPPVDAEVVRVDPLPGSEPGDQGAIIVRREIVKRPNATYYLVLNEESARYLLAPGIIVVDTGDRGCKLEPFWDQIVLVNVLGDSYAGYLLCDADPSIEDVYKREFSRRAFLSGRRRGSSEGIKLGQWSPDILDKENFREEIKSYDDAGLKRLVLRVAEGSRRMMMTREGIEVVGRVIDFQPWVRN
jgi:transcriptional regulator with XRE-family HTH domain